MLSAADYYASVVRPTVEDFCRRNSEVRLAMLACMATVHVVDHVVQNRMPGATKGEAEAVDAEIHRVVNGLAAKHLNFAVVRAYGTASKHGRIGAQRRFQPGFDSSRGIDRPPSFAGTMVAGVSFIGDTVGGITVAWDDDAHINLTLALQNVLTILEQEFDELVPQPDLA